MVLVKYNVTFSFPGWVLKQRPLGLKASQADENGGYVKLRKPMGHPRSDFSSVNLTLSLPAAGSLITLQAFGPRCYPVRAHWLAAHTLAILLIRQALGGQVEKRTLQLS